MKYRFLVPFFVILTILPSLLPVQAAVPTVVVLGDSLSAGYGINLQQGWVMQLQERLHQEGYRYRVVNASISGDTTADGLARLPHTLTLYRHTIVIVELGGNDGLRGLPLSEMQNHLAAIIHLIQAQGSKILLIGIRLPPNYGPTYTKKFHAIYSQLAHQYHISGVPFLLEGVAGHNALMQSDGIHPLAQAQPRILDNVWPYLKPLLR